MKKLALVTALLVVLSGCSAPPPPAPETLLVAITAQPVEQGTPLAATVDEIREVATSLGAELEVRESADESGVAEEVQSALSDEPDVILGLGYGTLADIDPAAASNLDQQFLLVGAEALEPTGNLTAMAIREWEGLYLAGVAAATTGGPITVSAPSADPYAVSQIDRFIDGVRSVSDATVEVQESDTVDAGCRTVTNTAVALADALPHVLAGDTGGVYSYGVAESALGLDPACAGATSPDVAAAAEQIADGTVVVTDPLFNP